MENSIAAASAAPLIENQVSYGNPCLLRGIFQTVRELSVSLVSVSPRPSYLSFRERL